MSRYELDKALWVVIRDPEQASQLDDDPDEFLKGRDLAESERNALLAADTRGLYEAGAIPFLVYQFALHRAGGFTLEFVQSYVASLDGAESQDLVT